jgi:uncharacterized iron-regulated membrane protein
MRNFLIVAHRWTALVVGIILFGISASGAALVFEGAIDRALNPGLWHVTPSGPPMSIDSLIARVAVRYPADTVGVISFSSAPDRAWTMNADALTLFVNPYTGEIKGTRTPRESQTTFARRLHVFHVEFFAGRVGRSVVGAVTAIALFLVLTGIILWWPDKLVRITTTASWKRINFDLHHAFGSVAALILIVITASGLVIHYGPLTQAVRSLDTTPPAAPPRQPAAPANAPPRTFDALAAAGRGALPGASIMAISNGDERNPAVLAMRFPEDHTPAGRSRVFVDRYSGAILATVSTRDAQLGTRIDNLKRSLHTGDILGKPTEAIWLLAAIVLASQVVTGVLMWWNARKARR